MREIVEEAQLPSLRAGSLVTFAVGLAVATQPRLPWARGTEVLDLLHLDHEVLNLGTAHMASGGTVITERRAREPLGLERVEQVKAAERMVGQVRGGCSTRRAATRNDLGGWRP